MLINKNETIWYEKYRPQQIKDLIITDDIRAKLQHQVDSRQITNMLFCSETPGTGKTSTVNAIVRESGIESLFINASLENGIDTLRGKIKQFASACSFNGDRRLVILDESDNFSENFQAAFRGIIEEFSSNCSFIMTCNYVNKIIPAIVNRFEVYNFDNFYTNRESLIKQIFQRLKFILEQEQINFDPKDLIPIINTYYPSVRGMFGFTQKSIINNNLVVDQTQLQNLSGFNELIENIKQKKFEGMLNEVYKVNNPDSFYTYMYKNLQDFNQKSRPQILICIAKYQFQSASVRDKNLNLAACCVELANFIN